MAEPITFTDGEGRFHVLRVDDESNATPDDLARAGYYPEAVVDDDSYLEAIGEAIDHDLGWNTPEDEERGEYPERIRQVARELKALRALETRLRAAPARMPYPLRDDVLALLEVIDEARK